MNKNRILYVVASSILLLVSCAPRMAPSAAANLDRGPTAPPIVVDAGRGEVFTEAFRLMATAPGVDGFEVDTKHGVLGNVTERAVCGNSGGWTIVQSDQGGGFISAASESSCQHFNALGVSVGRSTESYRISIAIAGTVSDRSEVVVSTNSPGALLAVFFITDSLLTKFGGGTGSE